MRLKIFKILLFISILFSLNNVFAGKWEMNELPYANPIGFEYEWDDEDNIEFEVYVTDFFQQEYQTFEKKDPYTYTLYWQIDNGKVNQITNLKAGNHSIKVGVKPIGSYNISLFAIDSLGRKSAVITKEFRVLDKQNKYKNEEVYIMTENDLQKYNIDNKYQKGDKEESYNGLTNLKGLQKLLDEKKAAGFKKVVLYPGTYMVETVRNTGKTVEETDPSTGNKHTFPVYDISKPLFIPNEFTLDLNGATLKQVPHGAAGGLIVIMQDVYDSHLMNGTLEGDYYEHKYENFNKSEWANCLSISTGSKYCSTENVIVKDVTGYASTIGFESKFFKEGETKAPEYTYYYPMGGPGNNMVQYGDPNNNRIITGDFVDISKVVNSGCDFIQVGKYLGYQGNPTGDENWTYIAHFYNENKTEIASFPAYFYRRVKFPKEAKYFKMELVRANDNTLKDYPDIKIFSFKYPTNCKYENIDYINCRVLGCAPAATESFILKNCVFDNCGQAVTKCAFDAEDGWDMMHDMWLTGNTFKNNPFNEILFAGGHNITIEKNQARIYLWPRCKSVIIRDNSSNYISCDAKWPTKIYRNNTVIKNVDEKGNVKYDGIIKSTNSMLRDNETVNINAKNAANMTIVSGGLNTIDEIRDSVFLQTNFNNYSNGGKATNCTFMLLEEYKQKLINENKPLEYKLSINVGENKPEEKVIYNNCTFKDKVDIANHNHNTRTFFNGCSFEDMKIHTGTSSDNVVEFDNCKIKSTANELLKFGSFSYDEYMPNITFKNSTIEHTGETFINIYSYPLKGISHITFNNCIIRKEVGNLLYRRTIMSDPKYLLNINFNNCDYSPYIETHLGDVAANSKDCVKVNFNNNKNKDTLIEKINAAKSKDLSIYTEVSKNVLLEKIKEAEVVRDDNSANEQMIFKAIKELDSAILNLVLKVNKKDLEYKTNCINNEIKKDYKDFTIESGNRLNLAILEAERILLDENAKQEVVDSAYLELCTAYDLLETDKKLLKEKVDEIKAEKLNYAEYTVDSVNVLKIELKKAENILNIRRLNKIEVDNSYKNLISARNNLIAITNKSILQEKVNKINLEFNGVYTQFTKETAEALKNAMINADNVIKDVHATQKDVENAIINLDKAYAALETNVDKSALKNKVAEINGENLVKDKYTTTTWNNLQTALAKANEIIAKKRASQVEVTNALNNLVNARTNLALKADKTALRNRVEEINKEFNGVYTQFTKETAEALKNAMAEAEKLLSSPEPTQEMLAKSLENLNKAYAALETNVDKSALKNKVAEINGENLVKDKYTTTTWNNLQTALAKANEIIAKKRASQVEVTNALNNLVNARTNLALKADKTALRNRVEEINKEFNGVYTQFTKETAEALKNAMAEAEKLLSSPEPTQEMLAKSLENLNKAYAALETNVDKSALKNKVAEINGENLVKDKYTTTTWNNLQTALAKANEIIAKKRASQVEVTNALNNLVNARTNLALKADKTTLRNRVEEINKEFNGVYTQFTKETAEALKNAMAEAEKLLSSPEPTQEMLAKSLENLNKAYAALETNVDKSALKNKVAEINGENLVKDKYTTTTWNNLQTALAKANEIIAKKRASQVEVTNALNNLVNARTNLALKADKTALRNRVEEINKEFNGVYTQFTKETAEALKNAMAEAEKLLSSPEPTQEMLAKSLENLNKAYAALETNVDKSALKNKVAEINGENLVKDKYTTTTWNNLQTALAKANEIIAKKRASQVEVTNALNNLVNARTNLALKADKTALRNRVEEINKEFNGVYTQFTKETAEALKNAMAEAEKLLSSPEPTQEMLAKSLENLNKAYAALETNVDKSALKNKVDEIKNAKLDYTKYTQISVDNLKKSLTKAEEILNKKRVTLKEVTDALNDITNAYNNLELKVDKSALNKLITSISNLNLNLYTKESVDNLNVYLEKAKKVAENSKASQDEINKAEEELLKAKNNLKLKIVDKEALKNKIMEAEKIDKNKYTEVTVELLNESIIKAKEILQKENATSLDVENAIKDLDAKINGLELKVVNKDSLKALIEKAENINYSNYTDDTVNYLKNEIINAKNILNKTDATELEVKEMENNLNLAINKLIQKPSINKPNKGEENNKNEIVNTGDSFIIVAIFVLIITLFLNILYFTIIKKNKK